MITIINQVYRRNKRIVLHDYPTSRHEDVLANHRAVGVQNWGDFPTSTLHVYDY
jgi:hypothetical protein